MLIGGQVITSREVQLAHAFESYQLYQEVLLKSKALKTQVSSSSKTSELQNSKKGEKKGAKGSGSKSSPEAKSTDWLRPLGSETEALVISQLIVETLLVLDAEQFSISQVPEAELLEQQTGFQKVVESTSLWKEGRFSSAEVKQLIQKKLRARQYMQFLTDSTQFLISDQQVQDYFQRNRTKFGPFPLADFQDSIRKKLKQELQEEKLRDRIESLRKKYKVRIVPRAPVGPS